METAPLPPVARGSSGERLSAAGSIAGGCLAVGGLLTVDSFLLDPPLLFASGLALALLWHRLLKPRGAPFRVPVGIFVATLALYWSVSLSLYFDLPWIDWLARGCGAQSGRDWMLNSGVFHFEFRNPGTRTHVVSAGIFLTYPLWLVLGTRLGDRLFVVPAR